ncbi:MAG: nucleoside deaminase [Candidatus Cloacimonetes bacterium]|nr:nucleoside deaminase [Candidatus Cloacimonadota bacterium]
MTHAHYLRLATEAAAAAARSGGGPFGAVLKETNGDRVFVDHNHVTEGNDPTAHAEVSVIRQACRELGTFALTGYTLYASCEPCPMCLGAALWARVDAVYFNANREDAAQAGFDDSAFYELLDQGEVATELRLENAAAPFDAWRENSGRTEY